MAGVLIWFLLGASPQSDSDYVWLKTYTISQSIRKTVDLPPAYKRITVVPNSFAAWLVGLPLKAGKPDVLLFDGRRKYNQTVHHKVIEIDVEPRDLQQCADAIIRLRAEYFYARKNHAAIKFKFTSGDVAAYQKWVDGFRPVISGNNVTWVKSARAASSYENFRRYLTSVFTYAGTHSLSREMKPVGLADMQIGDVFIQGGFPGHAVIVVDMAVNEQNGKKIFLLAQSFMPAQDMHILNNPGNADLSPWYPLDFGQNLDTPEWDFKSDDLKRLP